MIEVAWPKQSLHDPVMGGSWQVYDGWVWWVWQFRNGWREWIPAMIFLLGDPNREASVHRLHEVFGVELCDIYSTTMDQLNYTLATQDKSNWYYHTIPELSYSFACVMWGHWTNATCVWGVCGMDEHATAHTP